MYIPPQIMKTLKFLLEVEGTKFHFQISVLRKIEVGARNFRCVRVLLRARRNVSEWAMQLRR